MSSRTKKPIESKIPETKTKTTVDMYRELDEENRLAKGKTDEDLYKQLDEEIKNDYKQSDAKKSDLVNDIYGNGVKYLEEIEKNKKTSFFKKLLHFLMNW